MHKFILRRLLMMVPVLFGVMFVIFTLVYITPDDPAMIILGGDMAHPEAIAALRAEMGLDDPFLVQFARYVGRAVQLDLGTSFSTRRPVFDELADRFPNTATLAGLGVLLAIVVGIPLGILCSTKHHSIFDTIASMLGVVALSVPNFWLGLILILFFSFNLRMLPVSGLGTPAHWIMPTLTVGLSAAGEFMRFSRSSMLEVIRQDYIRTARAKGQKESVVIFRHALKNAMIPVITIVGLSFGTLLGGAVLTETVFALPGVGSFMVHSIMTRDFPIIQGGVLMIAVAFSFVNLLVDILYALVDPRVRSQYK